MAVLVILQSRMSSSRLQAKAMQTVAGRPLVVLAAQRTGRSATHRVVVATSTEAEDDVIARTVRQAGIEVARGPLDDTLERFKLAVDQAGLADSDDVVRLTGDNPMPDSSLVDELVRWRHETGAQYGRVGGPGSTVPYGVAAEVFTAGQLRDAARDATSGYDHEHVTPYIRRRCNDEIVPLADVPEHWALIRGGSVDSFVDLMQMHEVFARFPGQDPVQLSWRELSGELARISNVAAPVMRQNELGQSAVLLDVAGSRQDTDRSDLDLRALITTAGDAGVTHLDIATGLTPGQGEAAVEVERSAGTALVRGARERLTVVAAVRGLDSVPITADADWGRAKVDASVERSRRELGVGKVDALVVRPADLLRAGGAVRNRLLALRDEGVTRQLGVAVDDPAQLPAVLADHEVGYLQVPAGVADPRWSTPEVAGQLATRPDLIVVARGVVPGPDHELRPVLDKAAADLGRAGAGELGVAYTLGHPWATSVSVPAADAAELRSMTRAAAQPLTGAEMAEVRRRVDAVTRSERPVAEPSRTAGVDPRLGLVGPNPGASHPGTAAGLPAAGSQRPGRIDGRLL